ncbi:MULTISPECIES: DUF6262 family protein [unclassified Streptomyces]|uniref:DUF6262 family protein n=1 Tax=unclassified Streptomyces TaxID=2593676 RepID=UPI0003A55FB2|nr:MULTISPECIES: DUF6262 family protein [unclassified Streptomyces]
MLGRPQLLDSDVPPQLLTAAALAARRRKTEAAIERVHQAIARHRREKAQVGVADVTRRADVSRTFRYDNVEARAAVAAATAQVGEPQTRTLSEQGDEREATWRERALNADESLRHPTQSTPTTPLAPPRHTGLSGGVGAASRHVLGRCGLPRR